MSRQVQVLVWCDNHGDERVPGQEMKMVHPLTGKPVKVDLCEPCKAEITMALAPVVAMLDKARPVRRPQVKTKPDTGETYSCPDGNCTTAPRPFRGMVQHVRQGHKDLYAEWKAGLDKERAPQLAEAG